MTPVPSRWWGVEHICGGVRREYPTLHWADEPEIGAGPRRAFECDACGDRYAFFDEKWPVPSPPSQPTEEEANANYNKDE